MSTKGRMGAGVRILGRPCAKKPPRSSGCVLWFEARHTMGIEAN